MGRPVSGSPALGFVYTVYVISTLGFVAQLEPMPPDWVKWEEQMLRILVPGPRRWWSPADLHRLRRDFGFPHEFANAYEVARAAKLRVYAWEARGNGGIDFQSIKARIDQAVEHTPFSTGMVRRGTWAQQSLAHVVWANRNELREQGVTVWGTMIRAAGAQRLWTEAQERLAKKRFQKAAVDRIQEVTPSRDAEGRLRQKLASWITALLPPTRARRAKTAIGKLSRDVPPRVAAAVLRI